LVPFDYAETTRAAFCFLSGRFKILQRAYDFERRGSTDQQPTT
jgi:hypothetical protein